MSTLNSQNSANPSGPSDGSSQGPARVLGGWLLSRLKIGAKLNLGFGVLVLLTAGVIALSFFASERATTNMSRTTDLRAPSTLASSRAQADLLKMLADVRGYLALGDQSYREGYAEARGSFEANLAILEALAQKDGADSQAMTVPEDYGPRLEALKLSFAEWSSQPERLFALHDDQLEREPALRLLIKEGNRPIAQIVVAIKKMIETQRRREPSVGNMALMGDMASFQSSFFAMVAGLRGYVTTARDNFKFEYTSNRAINDRAMDRLVAEDAKLSGPQQKQLKLLAKVRESFLPLPDKIFESVEGERRRMDLFLFRTQAIPPAESMLRILGEIAADQQSLLQRDLDEGRLQLTDTQSQLVAAGLVALVLALLLAYVFRANIVGPVQRLTSVAAQVGAGQLSARARVESQDEIGALAQTFNTMSTQLGQTLDDLEQRRKAEAEAAEALRRQNEFLAALHNTAVGMVSRLDLNELLSDLVVHAGKLLGTPHGYIYLVEPAGDALERRIGVGAYSESVGFRLNRGEGVAGRVWQSGDPLVIDDYGAWDGRLAQAKYEVEIRAVMAAPLKTGAQVTGVLGMAYDSESDHSFGADEVASLNRFAQLASISLDNARLYTAAQDAMSRSEDANKRVTEQNRLLESVSTKLSKYLSPQVYASIFSGRQNVEISSQRKKLTVFFSDIADFTETTDSLESEELTNLLNRYLTEMSRIALDHGATIDKYVGDAILAFFGDPETKGAKDDARACVRMAIAMQRRMVELQSEWRELGLEKPFQLRIGINTGFCTVGNFGSEDRMDYTIIGNQVNLASRLESRAELGDILIAHETYALVKDTISAEEQSPITVKGFARPVRTYRVAGVYDDLAREGKVIHHQADALNILVNLEKLTDEDRTKAIRTMEDVLAKLKAPRDQS
jgi:class 3 adenylate cyclase/CHASE3 domain sensor protein/putative methionine-R-sulfoxide reductase with GAF domain